MKMVFYPISFSTFTICVGSWESRYRHRYNILHIVCVYIYMYADSKGDLPTADASSTRLDKRGYISRSQGLQTWLVLQTSVSEASSSCIKIRVLLVHILLSANARRTVPFLVPDYKKRQCKQPIIMSLKHVWICSSKQTIISLNHRQHPKAKSTLATRQLRRFQHIIPGNPQSSFYGPTHLPLKVIQSCLYIYHIFIETTTRNR